MIAARRSAAPIRRVVAAAGVAAWLAVHCTAAQDVEEGLAALDRGDTATAFEILDDLALDGDPRALAAAGRMWEHDVGTRRDPHEALRYYRAVAARGGARLRLRAAQPGPRVPARAGRGARARLVPAGRAAARDAVSRLEAVRTGR